MTFPDTCFIRDPNGFFNEALEVTFWLNFQRESNRVNLTLWWEHGAENALSWHFEVFPGNRVRLYKRDAPASFVGKFNGAEYLDFNWYPTFERTT